MLQLKTVEVKHCGSVWACLQQSCEVAFRDRNKAHMRDMLISSAVCYQYPNEREFSDEILQCTIDIDDLKSCARGSRFKKGRIFVCVSGLSRSDGCCKRSRAKGELCNTNDSTELGVLAPGCEDRASFGKVRRCFQWRPSICAASLNQLAFRSPPLLRHSVLAVYPPWRCARAK